MMFYHTGRKVTNTKKWLYREDMDEQQQQKDALSGNCKNQEPSSGSEGCGPGDYGVWKVWCTVRWSGGYAGERKEWRMW